MQEPVEQARTVDEAPVAERAAAVAAALADKDHERLRELTAVLEAPDLADLLELLAPEQRVELVQALGSAFDFEALSELDETVRDQLSEALPKELLAKAVAELDSDDAAYVLEGLEEHEKQDRGDPQCRFGRQIIEAPQPAKETRAVELSHDGMLPRGARPGRGRVRGSAWRGERKFDAAAPVLRTRLPLPRSYLTWTAL